MFLPRGLREKAIAVVADGGSRLEVADDYGEPDTINAELRAVLNPDQTTALDEIAAHELGTLVAPPGSGKTVVGCALIARQRVPTLVIVDRKPLVDQWRDRLVTHLDLTARQVGQIGGGRNRTTGVVDLAMAQSLARRDDLAQITERYGMVIVDECHHVPAVTFERAVREIPVRRWVGLTATPYRRDGLQALMAMHCGPVRHTMTTSPGSALRVLDLIVHETEHQSSEEGQPFPTILRGLVDDDHRTRAMCDDIVTAASAGRNSLVLTRWTKHLDKIVARLEERGVEPLVLHGQLGKRAQTTVVADLESPRPDGGMVLAATAGLIGEGFDCPPLDTLFLAFPIKFKGNVVQYVGRVLRPTDNKTRVEVHDYVDIHVPVLARMHVDRRTAYTTLGFQLPKPPRRPRSLPARRPPASSEDDLF